MEQWLAPTLTILSILAILAGFSVWFYKNAWKPLSAMYKDIYSNKAFVEKVMYNLSPNGGNSLVDKINKIADKLEEVHNDTRLIKHKQQINGYLSNQPLFECDNQGYCVCVNKKWSEITGITEDEALGNGWVNAIHPVDRQRVLEEWQRAIKSDVQFNSTYKFYNRNTGVSLSVKGLSRIERNHLGDILFIVGTFEIIPDTKTKQANA
jgi:PAS domain S-box-containing protein